MRWMCISSLRHGLASAPALGERRHGSLARLSVAVRSALDAVGTVAARPHPRAALRRSRFQMEDAADNDAVLQHIVVVLGAAESAVLEDQRRHWM